MGGYRRIWENTGGYGRIQEDMGGYRRIWEDTGGYGRMQQVKGGLIPLYLHEMLENSTFLHHSVRNYFLNGNWTKYWAFDAKYC